jgi:Fic family protein
MRNTLPIAQGPGMDSSPRCVLCSNSESHGLPPLVRIGLAHVQFETIHPYLDGNGRIGRLLITLLLEHWKLLSAPLLYLSLYFKRHRADYYRLLGEVRRSGDWEAWLGFFLEGLLRSRTRLSLPPGRSSQSSLEIANV